ncbi:hypothetical protein R4Y45_06330 [Holzapfeliella sp. He02]|uniref:Uncharacterized protein n=1 Tax=Holzapfeliella saturejae TaxID=3082953 RepID=A0ABU8SHH1_9LACO
MNKKQIGLGLVCAVAVSLMTQTHSPVQAATAPDHTATVNYVTGYGITTWKNVGTTPEPVGHYLATGSQWLTNDINSDIFPMGNTRAMTVILPPSIVYGGLNQPGKPFWYLVGNNEYASSKYYDVGGENSAQALNAVVVATQTSPLWSAPKDSKFNQIGTPITQTGTVASGSQWRTFERQVVSGKTWYQVGQNQWLEGTHAQIKSEDARDDKTFNEFDFSILSTDSIPNQYQQAVKRGQQLTALGYSKLGMLNTIKQEYGAESAGFIGNNIDWDFNKQALRYAQYLKENGAYTGPKDDNFYRTQLQARDFTADEINYALVHLK